MPDQPVVSSALLDARGRLQSMGVLYDRLYRAENLHEMPLRQYLEPLVREVTLLFPEPGRSTARVEGGEFSLGVKTLSAVGILVNELLTNAAKHAFAGRSGGTIVVSANGSRGG